MSYILWFIAVAALGYATIQGTILTVSSFVAYTHNWMQGWVVALFGTVTVLLAWATLSIIIHHPF